MMYCPDCGAEIGEDDTFCKECGKNLEDLSSNKERPTQSENSSETDSSEENIVYTERARKQEAVESDNSGQDTEGDGINWTLSLVLGTIMSGIAFIIGIYYVFAQGNLVSGVLYWLAGSTGGNYLFGDWNISKWLAITLFVVLWMAGSVFIGTGAG